MENLSKQKPIVTIEISPYVTANLTDHNGPNLQINWDYLLSSEIINASTSSYKNSCVREIENPSSYISYGTA